MVVLALLGCGPPGVGVIPGPELVLSVPEIVDFSIDCDVASSQWTVAVEASSWTGGGTSHWTLDGQYVERHRVNSLAYAEDGSSDSLQATLSVVSDWRSQSPGSSTAFTCAQFDDLDIIFRLDDRDGNSVDCRVTGPDPTRWEDIDNTPTCDAVWRP